MTVSPGSLTEQRRYELWRKFNLRFEMLGSGRIESAAAGSVFTEAIL
ncbi:MAG: hypothetical protein LBU32_27630 [Clostridiales bacterium]|nr:hypothetical protein [Clostridiales bacterium]